MIRSSTSSRRTQPSRLISRQMVLAASSAADVPWGEYARNEPNGRLESNGHRSGGGFHGQQAEQGAGVGQDLRPVLQHLLGPGQPGHGRDRLEDERQAAEPQRFPSL